MPLEDGYKLNHALASRVASRLLPHLTSLRSIELSGYSEYQLAHWILPHISTLVNLQQLDLFKSEHISTTSLRGIEGLTALKDLSIKYCELEPSCLLPITTGLTRLHLGCVPWPWPLQQDGGLGMSELLRLLARLTALRHLTLDSAYCNWPQQLSAHSALTASSNLEVLQIRSTGMQGTVWGHVFLAGRKLPKLRSLNAQEGEDPFASADIKRLISCCPALQNLEVALACDVDAALARLNPLTALTQLKVCGIKPSALSSLAFLTQLRDLEMTALAAGGGRRQEAAYCRMHHLVHVVALTGLTRLCVPVNKRCLNTQQQSDSEDTGWLVQTLELTSKAPAGAPPDTWVQLLEQCAADTEAQPAVTSYMLRQLQQQQQQMAAAEAGAAAAVRAEAATRCGQVQALRRQQEEVQAAARAEVAELRGQVQVLQGQLQQLLTALKRNQQQV